MSCTHNYRILTPRQAENAVAMPVQVGQSGKINAKIRVFIALAMLAAFWLFIYRDVLLGFLVTVLRRQDRH